MFSKYYYTTRLLVVAMAFIAIGFIAGCHSGGAVSENESGGTETTPTTELGTSLSARDGAILEFSEAMDTASVEDNLSIIQGDFSASADISKSVSDGDQIDAKSFLWASDHKSVRVKWPARFSHAYTLILDTGAKSEAGVNIPERLVLLAEVGLNPYNFDGDADDTADFDILDGFVTDTDGNALPTFLVWSLEGFAESMAVDFSEITLTEYWYYSDANLSSNVQMLGRLDDGNVIVGAKVDNKLYLFSYDDSTAPLMIIGSDMYKLNSFYPAGDINGDGYQDFGIVGSISDTTTLSAIILGRSSFFSELGETPATDENLYAVGALIETKSLANCSNSVTIGLGDLDGDGYNDVASCYQQGSEGSVVQTVNVYYGAETASLSSDAFGGSSITNTVAESGISLTGVIAADLNGDMIDDLVVPYFETASSSKAANIYESGALIFFGEKDVRPNLTAPDDADVDVKLGTATALKAVKLGYIDEDEFEDIAILVTDYDSDLGKVTSRFLGINGKLEWDAVVDGESTAVDCSEALYENTCNNLTSLGDVNNDGYDDFGVWLSLEDGGVVTYSLYIFGGGFGAATENLAVSRTGGFKMLGYVYYDSKK